jgi:uncharacterized protein (TIGR03435 family)
MSVGLNTDSGVVHRLAMSRRLMKESSVIMNDRNTASAAWQLLVGAITLIAAAPFAAQQTGSDPEPAFETTSVRSNSSGTDGRGVVRIEAGAFSATNRTLRELITYAYQRHPLDRREVSGGPAWIDVDRFDIEGRANRELSKDPERALRQTLSMLQSLLLHRFHLKIHEATQDGPIYALMVATDAGVLGPRLQKTAVDCNAILKDHRAALSMGPRLPCSLKTSTGRLSLTTAEMPTIAGLLSQYLDRPVIDGTGLTGRFDLELEASEIRAQPGHTPQPRNVALSDAASPSIIVAIREQLGLRLHPQTGRISVLVVDHAERPIPD